MCIGFSVAIEKLAECLEDEALKLEVLTGSKIANLVTCSLTFPDYYFTIVLDCQGVC
ncbi:MAG: hypothetical protein N4J56_007596 [Chroococcidiopsis sp. SAG 2025]|uniref:hypothetical protein n=1 Tax=Chroococcidiopsis sp. SAG 2025 TaxID=171389 RepID=UPI0029370CF2|nr:hypothetical protein [Chroococcidiopsis sp. SAG 2025]MDV2997891.1 hypothetical protein [Chroococcidiopsis sp. SAG 2025]